MLRENFRDANEALRGLRLAYWLDCGALLGLMREGALLDHDTDIDFGVLGVDKAPRLEAWMNALGFRTLRVLGKPHRGYEQRFRRHNSNVDIFYFYPTNSGGYWCGSWWKRRHLIISEFGDLFLPTQPHDFLGQRTYLPAQPENVLQARYGDWQIVKKDWRWYRDPPCIRPETLPPEAEMEAFERARQ